MVQNITKKSTLVQKNWNLDYNSGPNLAFVGLLAQNSLISLPTQPKSKQQQPRKGENKIKRRHQKSFIYYSYDNQFFMRDEHCYIYMLEVHMPWSFSQKKTLLYDIMCKNLMSFDFRQQIEISSCDFPASRINNACEGRISHGKWRCCYYC